MPWYLLRGRAPWQNGRNSLSRAGKGPSSRVKNKKSKTTVSAFPNLSTNEKTLYDDSIIHESQNKAQNISIEKAKLKSTTHTAPHSKKLQQQKRTNDNTTQFFYILKLKRFLNILIRSVLFYFIDIFYQLYYRHYFSIFINERQKDHRRFICFLFFIFSLLLLSCADVIF